LAQTLAAPGIEKPSIFSELRTVSGTVPIAEGRLSWILE
jgi:hypothetical protein